MESKIRYDKANLFESKGIKSATLLASCTNDGYVYDFEVTTDYLYRMKNRDDNFVELLFEGKWHYFTASCLSDLSDCDISFVLLENNNKRSRYRLSIKSNLKAEDARADGLSLL